MMFQIAAIEWMGYKSEKDVCYRNVLNQFNHLIESYSWTRHAAEYFTIFEDVEWFKNLDKAGDIYHTEKIGFRYKKIIPEDGVCYVGYFQSAKNFNGMFARNLFTPSRKALKRLDGYSFTGTTCSIHVRRGNYEQLYAHHILTDRGYFNKAIDFMRSIGVDRFVVFSDGMEWCKDNFKGDGFTFVEDTDYIEMFLMSRCNHNIVCNSSFSWWGAFLGDPRNRVVIAPKEWFPNNEPDASDIIPDKWIKI